jgi:dienelactone hydrolase
MDFRTDKNTSARNDNGGSTTSDRTLRYSRRAWMSTGAWVLPAACRRQQERAPGADFLIQPAELRLAFHRGPGVRALSFANYQGSAEAWRVQCRAKLRELLGPEAPTAGPVRQLRRRERDGILYRALVMDAGASLTLPAYLLEPAQGARLSAVMALHGHGQVEQVIGYFDDPHRRFGLELARAGHLVLCPALRGFGPLADMSPDRPGDRLDYWTHKPVRQFTLVTDAFLYGETLIGETVADLLGWEAWLCSSRGLTELDVAGFSYGGDLAIAYAAFSNRIRKIFASGSFSSYVFTFRRCYNAPALGIPAILQWMDRSDIAGLNAPRPIMLHYGERDRPAPDNYAAAYNESVPAALGELRAIYRAFGAEGHVHSVVSPGLGHEVDVSLLRSFLDR